MNLLILFNNWPSLKCSIRCNFSAKHSGQKLTFVLPYTFSSIDHLILDVIWSSFNNHYILTILCFFGLFMVIIFVVICKPGFQRCICKTKVYSGTFICVFSTSAWYIRFSVRHWFCSRQFSLVWQLQPYSVVLGLNSLLLCNVIIDDMLLMGLQITFTCFY